MMILLLERSSTGRAGGPIWLRREAIESVEEYDKEKGLSKIVMSSGDAHVVIKPALDIVIAMAPLRAEQPE